MQHDEVRRGAPAASPPARLRALPHRPHPCRPAGHLAGHHARPLQLQGQDQDAELLPQRVQRHRCGGGRARAASLLGLPVIVARLPYGAFATDARTALLPPCAVAVRLPCRPADQGTATIAPVARRRPVQPQQLPAGQQPVRHDPGGGRPLLPVHEGKQMDAWESSRVGMLHCENRNAAVERPRQLAGHGQRRRSRGHPRRQPGMQRVCAAGAHTPQRR